MVGEVNSLNFNKSDFRAKVTVWASLYGNGVISCPYFFAQICLATPRCAFQEPV